jgi:hypothetical protein
VPGHGPDLLNVQKSRYAAISFFKAHMKNLQEATERICELKGSQVALDALMPALLKALPPDSLARLLQLFASHAEAARTVLLHATISEHAISSFERDVERMSTILAATANDEPRLERGVVDPVLLTTTRVHTFAADRALTSASGFFFERGERLYLITSRHVLIDTPSGHFPDRIEIELHTDQTDLSQCAHVSIALHRDGVGLWCQGRDTAGDVDVAVLEIDRGLLPPSSVLRAFTLAHLAVGDTSPDVGSPLAIVGFPLGFHDTVHHLPVVRQAAIASSFGVRFQGQGHFLTDARTHRGSSGAPVLLRDMKWAARGDELPWKLLGVHSTRMDMRSRDKAQDESLGLNCAWYADILMKLTSGSSQPVAGALS